MSRFVYWTLLSKLIVFTCCLANEKFAAAQEKNAAEPKSVQHSLSIAAAPYSPREEVAGEIKIVGANTLRPLAGLWKEEFSKYHPKAKLVLKLDGSELAAPILSKEKNVVALLSRQYLPEEIEAIEKASGGKVLQFVAAYDVLGVIVNKANPMEGITRAQARALLRKGTSEEKETTVWGDLGAQGEFAKVKIAPHGRSKTSGTRTYVRRLVLGAQEEERDQVSHDSSSAIADAVEKDPGGVGYASITHIRKDKVKVLGVAREAGEPFVAATEENIASGRYPLVRPLVLVAIGDDEGLKNSTLLEAIHLMISERGQIQVLKDGYLPAIRSDIVQGLDLLGLSSVK